MSKGRRNRENSYKEETAKEVALLRGLNVDLLKRMKGMEIQIGILTKENEHICGVRDKNVMEKSHLEECIRVMDGRMSDLANENTELKRELHVIGSRYQELETNSATTHKTMLYKLCDMEKRHQESLTLHMTMSSSLHEEKVAVEEEMKRVHDEEEEDRRNWKERTQALENVVSSLEHALKRSMEDRERAENACMQLKKNNEVLARRIRKDEGTEKSTGEDLAHARKAIEALFHALRTSQEDSRGHAMERKVLEERIRSLEGDLRASQEEHTNTKMSFEKLKESGAWTGVLMDRQEVRIKHLMESLLEERGMVRDITGKMENFMDQLQSERKDKDAEMNEVRRLHEEIKVLTQSLTCAREELGHKNMKMQGVQLQVEGLKHELQASKCNVRSLEGKLSELQKELQALRSHNAELQDQKDSLKQEYSSLKKDMKERILQLRKVISTLKFSHAKPTATGCPV